MTVVEDNKESFFNIKSFPNLLLTNNIGKLRYSSFTDIPNKKSTASSRVMLKYPISFKYLGIEEKGPKYNILELPNTNIFPHKSNNLSVYCFMVKTTANFTESSRKTC